MGIISSILFGSKKKDEDRLRRAADGQSVVGNVLGSSSYMREWSRQKKDVLEQFEKRERSLRKQWRYEDQEMARDLSRVQARYERKMGSDKAEKYYGAYERDHRREVERERERMLRDLEQEKNQAIRNISKGIKEWKE